MNSGCGRVCMTDASRNELRVGSLQFINDPPVSLSRNFCLLPRTKIKNVSWCFVKSMDVVYFIHNIFSRFIVLRVYYIRKKISWVLRKLVSVSVMHGITVKFQGITQGILWVKEYITFTLWIVWGKAMSGSNNLHVIWGHRYILHNCHMSL